MAKDVGKKFETDIANSGNKDNNIDVFRIKDSIQLKYVINVADFALYKKPNKIYLEAKSTKGKSISIGKMYKKDKKGNSYLYKYGRIDAKQVEKMIEKEKVVGVHCGFLLEFRGDFTHLVYYMTLKQFLDYVNDKNVTRKSIPIDYLENNCLKLEGNILSKYWLNDEMEYLSRCVGSHEDFNICYNRIKDTWDRSKQSIRTKYNKIKKEGGYVINNKYVHYEYDLRLLFKYIKESE